MPSDLIKQLLETGVHFGHKTSRWNPKMKKFIFGARNGIYIIDLERTEECLNKARDFLLDITSKGEFVLFVGTKKQAREVVLQEALRSGMYYVTERWPGGLLTNFFTVKKSIDRLKSIEKMKEDGTFEKLTKKEISRLEKELGKLKKNFGGIVNMEQMPKAIFIVDTKREETAIQEANRLGIPIVGIVDTNSNPDIINYPIPGNDDAAKAVLLISRFIADAIIEGRKRFLSYLSESGVSVPKTEKKAGEDSLLPEEEMEIKEIADLVETDNDSDKEKSPKSHSKEEDKEK